VVGVKKLNNVLKVNRMYHLLCFPPLINNNFSLNTPVAGPCTSGDCSDLKCWKNKMSNDYPATKCTNSICSAFPDCYDCVANGTTLLLIWYIHAKLIKIGCAWCEGAQQCYPSNNDGSDVCGEGMYLHTQYLFENNSFTVPIYCNNTQQCLKNTYGSSYYNTKCPQTSCSQLRNCRPCLNSGSILLPSSFSSLSIFLLFFISFIIVHPNK